MDRFAPLLGKKSITTIGPSELVIALFILSTIASPEGSTLNALSMLLLFGTFVLGVLGGRSVRSNSFLGAAFLFLMLSAASIVWSRAPEVSSARVMTFAYQFVSYFALMNLLMWKRGRVYFALVCFAIFSVVSGFNILVVQGIRFQDDRFVEGVVGAGQIAISLGIASAIAGYRFVASRKILWAALGVLALSLQILTSGRRGFLFVLVFGIVFMFVLASTFGRRIATLAAGLAVVALVLWIVLNVSFVYGYVGYRLESFLEYLLSDGPGDASSQGRDLLISFGLQLFRESPYLGIGISAFGALFLELRGSWNTSADNNYIELLAGLGLVGFALYYVPFVRLIVREISASRAGVSSERKFALASILTLLMLEFSTVTFYSKVCMLYLVLCLQVIYDERQVLS